MSAQRRSKPLAKSEEILYNNEQLFHADSSVISFGESSRSVAIVVRINDTFIRGIRLSLIDTLLLLYVQLVELRDPAVVSISKREKLHLAICFMSIEEEDHCFPPERESANFELLKNI